jgi:hypothetical protein
MMIPLPVLVWLSNVVFVGIPVAISLMTPSFLVPPSSFAEALLESHKVILVGAVTLSGVALVEVILIALKLGAGDQFNYAKQCVIGGLVLLIALIIGVVCYMLALITGPHRHPDMWQFALDFMILATAVAVALKFKYIDCRISDLEAEKGAVGEQGVAS